MSFDGVSGGDAQPLMGEGDAPKITRALYELEREGKIESRIRDGTAEKEYRLGWRKRRHIMDVLMGGKH